MAPRLSLARNVGSQQAPTDPAASGPMARPLSPRNFLNNERVRDLARRQSYFECTQHDGKRFDFDGRIIANDGSPMAGTNVFNTSGEKYAGYVPMRMRRPSAPYRLARAMVSSFTNLIFGEQRFPFFRVEGDPKSQDFTQALVKAAGLPVKMIRCRNIGGAVGTTALSWAFVEGRPRVNVHNGKNLFVHEWEDRDQLVPAHVSETYLFSRDEIDPVKRRVVRNQYVYRRDWTQDEDIVFKPVRFEERTEPFWQVDKWVEHGDGFAHFVWIQNEPHEEIDGLPDYHGLYENFDDLDLLLSVITRGAVLNLDPTLKLKMDIEQVIRMGVKKGSDNALVVGKDGDADYLELAGQSLTVGVALFNAKRNLALETGECVFPDPDKVAAAGLSSVAQKAIYQRMLGKADVRREQYGTGAACLLDQMCRVSRARWGQPVPVPPKAEGEPETEGRWVVVLPPLVTQEQPIDPLTGEEDSEADPIITKEEREPGEGGDIDAKWPPYFPPTEDDRSKAATTLSLATGGKAFFSQESAVEVFASLNGMEPEEEKRRVLKASKADAAARAEMFADQNGAMGGKPPFPPEDKGEEPPAGEEEEPAEKPAG